MVPCDSGLTVRRCRDSFMATSPQDAKRLAEATSKLEALQPLVLDSEERNWCSIPNDPSLAHTSCFILAGGNPLRRFLIWLTKSKGFEAVILVLIVSNTVFLAIEDPKAVDEPAYETHSETVYLIAFTAEMLLKILAFGLVFHEGAYLRESWNVLDFVIVCFMYLNFIPGFGNYTAFRALRVLRPLRTMNALKGLKVLVVGLLHSISGLLNVIMLSLFVFAIFGVLGVQLWSGLFRQRCQNTITGEFEDRRCSTSPGGWGLTGASCGSNATCVEADNPHHGFMSFDDTRWALLNVFQVMTFEGWPELLLTTYQVSGVASFIYFFFLILIASYFVPNLALAVINDKYQEAQRVHRRQEEENFASELEHQRLKEVELLNIRLRPVESPTPRNRGNQHSSLGLPVSNAPNNVSVATENSIFTVLSASNSPNRTPLRSPPTLMLEGVMINTEPPTRSSVGAWEALRNALHLITQGYPLPQADDEITDGYVTPFACFIIFCIFLNTLVLAAQHYDQPHWLDEVTAVSNLVFTVIFAAELLLIVTAIGFKRFFTDVTMVLDLIIVAVSIVEIFLSGTNVVTVFRALRLLRLLKLLRNFPSLRALVRVILTAVSDTLYLNVIMLLFLIVGALTGKQLFGAASIGVDETGSGSRQNFSNFYAAFLTVFQLVTTDGWVDVMWDTMNATTSASCVYFVVVVIFGTYVILNLFLSILITGFERQGVADDDDGDMFDKADASGRLALQRVIDRRLASANGVDMVREGADSFRISTSAKHLFELPAVITILDHPISDSMCRRCHSVKAPVLSPFPGELALTVRRSAFYALLRGRHSSCKTQSSGYAGSVLAAYGGSARPVHELPTGHCSGPRQSQRHARQCGRGLR
jgi:hypothetical protein